VASSRNAQPVPAGKVADTTRERILAAARALFAEQGYTAASISKIAKKAEVLPGSLYWAFESKEKLFAAIDGEQQVLIPARRAQAPVKATRRRLVSRVDRQQLGIDLGSVCKPRERLF